MINNTALPEVAVIMGSSSDWPTMKAACETLEKFGVAFQKHIISAHRTPDLMREFALKAHELGFKVIIAGAGGAAHLPGMTASYTCLPVIGVPVATNSLNGLDSLYSIVQMPKGIPVATVAIGNAQNAALLALQILATSNVELLQKIQKFRLDLQEEVKSMKLSD